MLGIRLEETRVYQEAKAKGEQIGEQRGEQALVLRLLTRQLKQPLPEALRSQVSALPLPQLEALGEALLDFTSLADLEAWLAAVRE